MGGNEGEQREKTSKTVSSRTAYVYKDDLLQIHLEFCRKKMNDMKIMQVI